MWNDISTLLSNISQDLLWNLVTPAEYNSAITYQHFLHFPRIEKVVDIVHRKYTWLKNQIFDFQVILGERINFVCIRMWITWCFRCFHLWINLFRASLKKSFVLPFYLLKNNLVTRLCQLSGLRGASYQTLWFSFFVYGVHWFLVSLKFLLVPFKYINWWCFTVQYMVYLLICRKA